MEFFLCAIILSTEEKKIYYLNPPNNLLRYALLLSLFLQKTKAQRSEITFQNHIASR